MRYPDSPILKDWAEKLVRLNNAAIFKGSVIPSAILFIEDTITGAPKEPAPGRRRRRQTATPKPKKSQKPFDIKTLHPALAERLDADYMLIWYKLRSVYMDVNKLRAYLLEALMRIKPGGGLNPYDVKTFKSFAKGVGIDYEDRQFLGLDVLEQQLIKGTQVQATIDSFGGKPASKEAPAVAGEQTQPDGLPFSETETAAEHAPMAASGQPDGLPADDWEPEAPFVKKADNLVPFPGKHESQQPTGTDPAS